MNQPPRHLFSKPPNGSACQDAAKIIEPKLDDTQCGFRRGRSTTEQIFTPAKFREILGTCQRPMHMCCRPRECVYGRVPREKLWGVLWE